MYLIYVNFFASKLCQTSLLFYRVYLGSGVVEGQ